MHNTASQYYGFDLEYHAVQLLPSELGSFASYLNEANLKGVNVTIPYKQQLFPFVDRLDSAAQKIGALNTISRENGELIGFNTDIHGFCEPLEEYYAEIESTRVVVFGTGGAARAIVFGLRNFDLEEVVLVSRRPNEINHNQWPHYVRFVSYDVWPDLIDETALLVNATPLGMYPKMDESPVRESQIPLLSNKICYDIVYNPEKTKFLSQAEQAGARTIGGLEMLIHQGSRAFEHWTGRSFPLDQVRKALQANI